MCLDVPLHRPTRGGTEKVQRFLQLFLSCLGLTLPGSVLQEFSAEERDPVKITEGWGVMFTCSPPPHYPGKEFPDFLGISGKEIWD